MSAFRDLQDSTDPCVWNDGATEAQPKSKFSGQASSVDTRQARFLMEYQFLFTVEGSAMIAGNDPFPELSWISLN